MTLLHVTEEALLEAVIELAQLHGFYCHHSRPAQRGDGSWRTALQGNAGFPDLVCVGNGRVLFCELKSLRGATSMAQDDWLEALRACSGVETYLWTPREWSSGAIERILKAAPVPAEETEVVGWPA